MLFVLHGLGEHTQLANKYVGKNISQDGKGHSDTELGGVAEWMGWSMEEVA